MIVKTPEKYIKGLPHKILSKIEGEPDYHSICLINKKLAANAATIKTPLGGGRHGYLALCLSPAAYASHSLAAFVPPTNPGATPPMPVCATAAAVSSIETRHAEHLRAWEEYNAIMQALKNQFIEAVDKIYLKAIQDRVTEYTNVTLYDMLQHLYDNYGKITKDKLEKNRQEMNKAYDVTMPIETLFAQIEDCVDFSDAAQSPYLQTQILNTVFLLIQKTGVFNKECRKWRKKAPADKTWVNFKTFFKEAHDDYKEDNEMTIAGASYNITKENVVANATTQDTLEHLAAATAADWTAVANLTSANAKLSHELQSKNTSFQALQKSMEKLQTQLTALQQQPQPHQQAPAVQVPMFQPQPQFFPSYIPNFNQNHCGRGRRGRGRGWERGWGRGRSYNYQGYQQQFPPLAFSQPVQPQQTVPQQQVAQQQPSQFFQVQTYCWTHGATNNPSHTSQTCRNPAPGHQATASINNTMGGNTYNLPH